MALVVRAYSESLAEGERKAVGYYDHARKYPGDEFEIADEKDFSPRWMKWVKGPSQQGRKGKADETE